MKSKMLIAIVGGLCCWAFLSFQQSFSSQSYAEGISFYQVNLVCEAATDIGCGSRSKPILLDLEKESTIREAWLNRAGTVTAIVWAKQAQPQHQLVSAIFSKHGKSITPVEGNAYQEQLTSFRTDKWYQGKEVDQLSMEEAGRIAGQIVDKLVSDGTISAKDAPAMRADVEAYIQKEFMTLKDVNLLNTTAYYDNWEREIRKMGEKYVGAGNMPEMELCGPQTKPSCTDQKKPACCSKSSANKSCSPPEGVHKQ